LEDFKKGIISYVDDCHPIDHERVVDVMLDIGTYYHGEYNHENKKGNKIIPKEFMIRKRMGNLVVLDRIYPSYCDVCKRVHESENAYVVGKYFYCRRAHM
jgi:hypothetical protein